MNAWLPVMLLARKNLIIFAVLVVACVTVVWGLNTVTNSMRASLTQMRSSLQQQQAQVEVKKADLTNVQSHIKRFKQLQSQGFVGEPDRALWVEELQASYQRLGLPEGGFTAQLAAAKPLTAGTATSMGSSAEPAVAPTEPQAHDLRFEMRNTVEPEVIGLIDSYRQTVNGRFRVDACKFFDAKEVGLTAQCVLRFISIPMPKSEAK